MSGVGTEDIVAAPGEVLVVLDNGEEFAGKLVKKTEEGIVLETQQGAELSFTSERIKEVLDHEGNPYKEKKDEPEKKKPKSPSVWDWLRGGK